MLPKTYLTQILLPRISEATRRLKDHIWTPYGGPYEVSVTASTKEHRKLSDIKASEFKPVTKLPHTWGNRHDQCWWQLPESLIIDTKWTGDTLYLDWRDVGEATLYADGLPWHGIDPGHPIVPLPDDVKDLKIESAFVRSGIWVPGNRRTLADSGSCFSGAYTLTRNDEAWRSWVAIDLLREYIDLEIGKQYNDHPGTGGSAGFRPTIECIPPIVRKLVRMLDDALDTLDIKGIAALLIGNSISAIRARR